MLASSALLPSARSLAAVPAATADPSTGTAAAHLASLADYFYEAQVRLDPLGATYSGDNRFNDQLTITIAPAEREKSFALQNEVLQKLGQIDRSALATRDALTYDVLQYTLRDTLAFEKHADHLLPMNHMSSLPVDLANLAGGQSAQPLVTVTDHEAFLRRLGRMPDWIDQAIINMREGMRRNIVQPRALIVSTLPQLKKLVSATTDDNVFYAPARHLADAMPAVQRLRLATAYRNLIETQLQPSLRRLVAFTENEYLPACRTSAGWGALPDGALWYQAWIRSQTTTDMTPSQIHALGLQEVARIQAEIAKVGRQLGYAGGAAGLTAWSASQSRFTPFKTDEEVLAAYRGIDNRIRSRLPALFGRLPRAALEIRPEPELTKATASAHYGVPAIDGSRPGIFWAVIQDPKRYETIGMTSLFIHEGQPGHHFQLALQQELDLPKFRKFGGNNAYIEGWALYAETLGRELGLYEDPVAYLGHLEADLHRAVRLVVDTGLHAKGWTREQTMQYMQATQGLTEAEARQSTERYMAWPGQALGYKIGALKIAELRQRAGVTLGAKFSLPAFHDAILEEAALPLSVLDARIDRWIGQQQRAGA
ncbi:MAG: DUF885 domain-containing protein [Herminiimonas sp.]|nr:DUF885 domain-containing protein [Herminiimonas sp.]